MTRTEYIQKVFGLRMVTNHQMEVAEHRVVRVLERALEDLGRILGTKDDTTLTYSMLSAKRAAIEELVRDMSVRLGVTIRTELGNTSAALTARYADSLRFYQAGIVGDISSAFSIVPQMAVRNVVARVWSDGRTFSDRIWRMNAMAKEGINQIVSAGVSRGQSAVSMSKQLRQYLLNPEITEGTSWTTSVKPSVTGYGSIHYRALTLARTEINNAYRESLVLCNAKNPVTLGVKWNLSKSHPKPDICDVWAQANLYGLGAGVYPAKAAPLDHPNGLCFMTEVLRPSTKWNEAKQQFFPVLVTSKEAILSPLSNMTPGQRNAAWKAFNSVQSMVSQYSRAA